MILSKRLLPTFLLLFLTSLLTISCSQQSSRSPQPVSQNQKPDWINKVPVGHYLGQASYALQTVKQAPGEGLEYCRQPDGCCKSWQHCRSEW